MYLDYTYSVHTFIRSFHRYSSWLITWETYCWKKPICTAWLISIKMYINDVINTSITWENHFKWIDEIWLIVIEIEVLWTGSWLTATLSAHFWCSLNGTEIFYRVVCRCIQLHNSTIRITNNTRIVQYFVFAKHVKMIPEATLHFIPRLK